MIIKMKQDGGIWLMIDGVSMIKHYSQPTGKSVLESYNGVMSFVPEDYDLVYFGVDRHVGFPTEVFISAEKGNGKSVYIHSQLEVYLMNDDGKTIERLN